ncbi:MAG TPA: hypothetical protein VEQ42_02300 [Pyrinomonadaceae bacterium]|nr:hypothetical protein [Pyrinomonadaceae bacterium]
MPKLFMWPAENEAGRELLERYVRPLAERLGARLELPQAGDDRRRLVKAIGECNAVICDCSVEPGHLYHKYVELPKVNNHVVVCSRTPLPRNVYAFHQHAPRHGSELGNEVLGRWLDEVIPAVVAGDYAEGGYWQRMHASIEQQKSQVGSRVGLFVSYRGRLYEKVSAKAAEVAGHTGIPARVVPKGEFVYETECMTRQMTWATVAGLEQEMHWARGVMMVLSEDYFDSFWTTSELLITLIFRRRPGGEIDGGLLLSEEELSSSSRPVAPNSLDAPPPSAADVKEYKRLLRQSDPGVVAPEMRRGSEGLVGLVFKAITYATGHARSPKGDWWWSEILVPCPRCRPRRRTAEELDWSAHLRLEGYGYFVVPRARLQGRTQATVSCTNCRESVTLVNRRPPRTLWFPGPLGRPWPAEMEMIEREPLWEVLE